MRGKANEFLESLDSGRITPAYAGKSKIIKFGSNGCKDHPRLCGEKCVLTHQFHVHSGSPPPMRGKAINERETVCVPRITPAYAGKRAPFPQIAASAWDHPRLCGEKDIKTAPVSRCLGSPPPMRGKGKLPCAVDRPDGITPAYAGKSHRS